MKKFKKILRAPIVSVLLFIVAIGLLGYSSINGAQAAISIFSQNYSAEVEMYDIGVSLLEGSSEDNLQPVSYRNYNKRENSGRTGSWDEVTGVLLSHLEGENIQLGKAYPEVLAARNSGTINQYVRLTVYRYWLDENGNKMQSNLFSPDLIELNFINGNLWVEDAAARTPERNVFYYQQILPAGGTTSPLTDTITIKDSAAGTVNYNADGTIAYKYKGKTFMLEATVDAVQDHNAALAKTSAWGQNR